MGRRPAHPNKHIEAALRYAESRGWVVKVTAGHAWGRIRCPGRFDGGCLYSVWSTPRIPEDHARQLLRSIEKCRHS